MEDELHKRYTDCVYFLASPLTCKKGIECEFRHSEMARLNPRDCWYWLAGNCFNPTCGFRHPPLEGFPGNSPEHASLPHQASVPVSKSNVPCYFYFNGFCNKGDSCSFLHGRNSNEGQASVEPPCDQLENTTKARESMQLQSKAERSPLVSDNILHQSPSPPTSPPDCEEAIVKSETLLPAENNPSVGVHNSSPSAGQSPEDPFDNCREPEEPWESSPDFDVLVNGGSENSGYEDDLEYLLAHTKDDMVLHEHLLQYDYENPVGYAPDYLETGLLCGDGMHELYNNPEEGHVSDHVRRVPKRSREMLLNPMEQSKKQWLSREVDFSERSGSDLRNHRRITSRSKRSTLSSLNARGLERPGRRHNHEHLQERLTSVVASNMRGEHREDDIPRHGQPRQSLPSSSRSRRQKRERRRQARRQSISSEISRGYMASRDLRPTPECSTAFTGPKTLAQIKAEKRKDTENRHF